MYAVLETLVVLGLHGQFVHYYLYVVVLVAVCLHASRYFLHLPINACVQETFLSQTLKQLTVVSLALAYHRGENEYAPPGIVIHYHVYDFLLGIFHHLLAGGIAVCRRGTCIQESQEVVYLRSGTNG